MGQHLFIIDPLEKLNFVKDTSLKLARALFLKNEKVAICFKGDLFFKDSQVNVHCHDISFPSNEKPYLEILEKKITPCDDFTTIHYRIEPPTDYQYNLNLILLESCKHAKIINSAKALLTNNEKLLSLNFPADSIETLISANKDEILSFIDELPKKTAIIKPLYLFGGQGVEKISTLQKDISSQKILQLTKNESEMIVVQPFLESIYDGEVRVFTFMGVAKSWCLKKPAPGSFLANTSNNAQLLEYKPSKNLEEKISRIGKELFSKGIYFAGFDVISELISEINITSPRLLTHEENDSEFFASIAEDLLKFN